MVVNAQRYSFSSFKDMAGHLDRWAGDRLDGPESWAEALVATRDWLDYSARNQVLLASYGIDGPVAGAETWRLVPSTEPERSCAVRAGEHGFPVRVPVTTEGTEPDPYLGGRRPTRAAVQRWEWRPVFSVAQLARRPVHDALVRPTLPASLTGPNGAEDYVTAVRKVATATVRGRLPKQSDPSVVLADAAGRLRRSEKRPVLDPDLRGQVAWLVANRVNKSDGAMPGFDPSGLAPRERWERMLDVVDPARKLTASLGLATGVDLCASPLPRMEIVDDRVVPAGHRRRLPAASLQALPIGKWVEVGPYTADEWATRGEQGSGRGAFLRLNGCAYLAAVEHGDEATWRLDDIDTRTGFGQLASGNATSLDDAMRTAVTAMHDRYPVLSATPLVAVAGASRPGGMWEPMAGSGRSAAEQRRLPCEVTIYVIPSSGGRWMPALNVGPGGDIERLPLVRGIDAARDAAETAGRRAVRVATLRTPVGVDGVVAELATSDDYSRGELAALIQARLLPDDQSRIAEAEPAELVELLGQAGVTPATTVAVLRAEHVDAADVAALLPTIGVPIADGIRALHTQWELSLLDAAEALDANATEMRAAGCSPVQIMATRPRDVLRVLPDDPHLWDLAAGTMATAGHSDGQIASHLVAHAPSVEAFVAGMGALTDDVATAMVLATSYGASGEYLAGASEHYGLSPSETAQVLTSLDVSTQLRVETLWERCDHDPDATRDLAVAHAALDQPTVRRCLRIAGLAPADEALSPATLANSVIDIGDADALIAQLPAPALPAAVEPAAPTVDRQLTFPTPQLTGQQP